MAKHASKHSNAKIIKIIGEHLDGDSVPLLSARYGIPQKTITNWCTGVSKSSLLREVEKERAK